MDTLKTQLSSVLQLLKKDCEKSVEFIKQLYDENEQLITTVIQNIDNFSPSYSINVYKHVNKTQMKIHCLNLELELVVLRRNLPTSTDVKEQFLHNNAHFLPSVTNQTNATTDKTEVEHAEISSSIINGCDFDKVSEGDTNSETQLDKILRQQEFCGETTGDEVDYCLNSVTDEENEFEVNEDKNTVRAEATQLFDQTNDWVSSKNLNSEYSFDPEDDLFPPAKDSQCDVNHGGSISIKTQHTKVLNNRERHLKKLPQVPAPDLSFKKSTVNRFISSGHEHSSNSIIKQKLSKLTPATHGFNILPRRFPSIDSVCYITKLISPGLFYIQVDEDYEPLDILMNEIHEAYSTTDPHFLTKADAKSRIGQFCVVNIELFDRKWYRAKVKHWLEKAEDAQKDMVCVQLIDYGDVVEVPFQSLRLIHERFIHLPMCSIKCHFAFLHPIGSSRKHIIPEWSRKAVEEFTKLIIDDCSLLIKYSQKEGSSYGVDLARKDCEEQTIGQYLRDFGYAKEILDDDDDTDQIFSSERDLSELEVIATNPIIVSQVHNAQGLLGITDGMSESEKVEVYMNNVLQHEEEAGNINEAVINYDPEDEKRICKFTRLNKPCYKATCPYSHEKLRQDGYTNDQLVIYCYAFNELPLPEKGDAVHLKITCVISVKKFYAQYVEVFSPLLETLSQNMNRPESVRAYKKFNILPAIGQIAVANYSDMWFRAKIIDITHQNKGSIVQVHLVDYGLTEEVPLSSLRYIPKEFLQLPFQAIDCVLNNIALNPEVPEEFAKEYFESHYLSQTFKAVVERNSPGGTLYVDLFNKNRDVGQELVTRGVAIVTTDYFPNDSEKVLVD